MENIIDHVSLNVHPGVFSLDKFIESDAPGTLSWLNNMDADDLNSDLLPLKDIERNSVAVPCAGTKLNKQLLPLPGSLLSVQDLQIEISGKIKFGYISSPEARLN